MISNRFASAAAAGLLLAASGASAASLSKNQNGPTTRTGQQVLLPPGPASITQNTNAATITVGNSVSCNNGAANGFEHTDNSYYRGFTLSSFNPPLDSLQFMVQTVQIGVEQANDGAGAGQPITAHVYDSTTNPPTLASIGAPLSSQPVNVADQALSLLNIPLTIQPVLINASDILVVEIFTPNGSVPNHSFFIGSNALGQSGPSFIRAADCGIAQITNLAAINFANMHIVMTVSGNNQVPVELQTFSVD